MRKGYCSKCKRMADHVHRFPANKERALEWAANMMWKEEFEELVKARGEESEHGISICTLHFAVTSYKNNTRTEGLRYAAMPEIVTPLLRSDHGYLVQSHPQVDNSMDWNPSQEIDPNESVHESQLSQTSWNGPIFSSQESAPDRFFDEESKHDKLRREGRERNIISKLKNNSSIMAHASFLELLELIPGCMKCKNIDAQRTFTTVGCVFIMETSCPSCKKWKWSSTPIVHDDRNGSFYEGNMDMSVAIFASGIPYERAVDFSNIMKLGITRKPTHYKIIREHMKPVILKMHEEDSTDIRARIKARYPTTSGTATPLSVIGDAQFDSRGFCAGICRYALLDDGTRYIIEHQIEARKENNGNSPSMEAKALALILSRLTKDKSLTITQLTTDKNSAVVSHMKKAHPTISHKLDKWHVVKNFKKNNKHAVDLKRNANLRSHWDHLLVHIWYAIEAADGNGELAVEIVRSAEFHLQNIHDLPKSEFSLIDQCLHGPLTHDPNKAYLDPTKHREQIKVLHDMLNSPSFMDNIRVCASRETTSPCEQFNSLVALIYIKKNHFYDKSTTNTLMQLAILHHNNHRKEILDNAAKGIIPPTRKKFSKSQGRYVEVTNQMKPTSNWKCELLARVKTHYQMFKDENMKKRTIGRPAHPLTLSSDDDAGDGSDGDDVLLDEHDGSDGDDDPEESIGLEDNMDMDTSDSNVEPNSHALHNTIAVLPPVQVNQVIRCSPRQFNIIYHSKGTSADLFTYINNRTGEVIIPELCDCLIYIILCAIHVMVNSYICYVYFRYVTYCQIK